jgi:predicted CXXCH cytochrome family protein
MNPRLRWWKTALIFGGVPLWGLVFVSCMMVNRTMFVPPQFAGAQAGDVQFVGSKECAQCHGDKVHAFGGATHSRLLAPGDNAKNVGCESCHGAGSKHVQSGGEPHLIVNPRQSPAACFQCHPDKRGEFSLANSHPVLAGKVSCADCHDPHKGDVVIGGGAGNLATMNDTCMKCHPAQRGPFVFEHEALRENCTTCHNPHGTVNAKMLRSRNSTLCLQCHYQQQTVTGQIVIGGRDHAGSLARGTCWSAGCHEAVHGSHVNSSLRF